MFVDRVLYGGPDEQRLALGSLAGAMAVGALASGFIVRVVSLRLVTLLGLAASVVALVAMSRLDHRRRRSAPRLDRARRVRPGLRGDGHAALDGRRGGRRRASDTAWRHRPSPWPGWSAWASASRSSPRTARPPSTTSTTRSTRRPTRTRRTSPRASSDRPLRDGLVIEALETWAAGEAAQIMVGVFLVAAVVTARRDPARAAPRSAAYARLGRARPEPGRWQPGDGRSSRSRCRHRPRPRAPGHRRRLTSGTAAPRAPPAGAWSSAAARSRTATSHRFEGSTRCRRSSPTPRRASGSTSAAALGRPRGPGHRAARAPPAHRRRTSPSATSARRSPRSRARSTSCMFWIAFEGAVTDARGRHRARQAACCSPSTSPAGTRSRCRSSGATGRRCSTRGARLPAVRDHRRHRRRLLPRARRDRGRDRRDPGRGHRAPDDRGRSSACSRSSASSSACAGRSRPSREIFNQLTNRDQALIAPEHIVYFRDVYDHLIRVTDELDTDRELVAGHARGLPLDRQQQPVDDHEAPDRRHGDPGRASAPSPGSSG